MAASVSDALALRTFSATLRNFILLAKISEDTGKLVWSDPRLKKQAESLVDELKTNRRAALVAGVQTGEQRHNMDSILNNCMHLVNAHKTWEASASPSEPAHGRLVLSLAEPLKTLDDMAAIADRHSEEKPERKPKLANRKRTGPKTGPNDPRDKWIYSELSKTGRKSRPLQTILNELNTLATEREWGELGSVNALRQAAIRYAKKNSLKTPPKRR